MGIEACQDHDCVVRRRVERVGLKNGPNTPPNFFKKRGGVFMGGCSEGLGGWDGN